ncbi:MAG: LysM domain-containing protein [Candidatus Riflebacteria bacterium]|nr:LysM domain-containing protein [Candidatus Riflebacteria bacterium]MDD3001895.1 LysM domain-containing protein [Candidatus Riflebacteria bacterium]
MRHKMRFAGFVSLFLLNLSMLSAEPVIRGFFIEKLPKKATSKELAPDKGIVLAHIFNCENTNMDSGSYQVGVEINDKNGKKKSYIVSPSETITAGSLKTFRLAVPVADIDKNAGKFRVFGKVRGQTLWSESYSFLQGVKIEGDKKITTLYVEAPPVENIDIKPVSNIEKLKADAIAKVENNINNKQIAHKEAKQALDKALGTTVAASAPAVTADKALKTTALVATQIKNNEKPKVNRLKNEVKVKEKEKLKDTKIVKEKKLKNKDIIKEDVVVQKTRDIDPNEFKKLKTIDEELIIYVIKEGDTLKSIASKYYGSASKERVIADLNFIEKTSSIKVGEEIIVDVRPLNKSKHG